MKPQLKSVFSIGAFRHAVFIAALSAIFAGCSSAAGDGGEWRRLTPDAGSNMLAIVEEFVKISPRDAGTPGAAKASRYLAQKIKSYGVEPVVDCWTETTAFGRRTFCNVYADFPGESGQTIVFCSHYDSKSGIEGFVGANDGASSTAVLLGLIEHFSRTRPKLQDTVRFAFFDGEEAQGPIYRDNDGLHGSMRLAAYYAAQDQNPKPLLAAIVFDMVGDANLAIDIPRNVTPWLGSAAMKASIGDKECPVVTLANTPIIDDHIPFLIQGFPAILFIDFTYGSAPGRHDYWHTALDTPDKLSAESLRQAGTLALSLLARIEEGTEVPENLRAAAPSK